MANGMMNRRRWWCICLTHHLTAPPLRRGIQNDEDIRKNEKVVQMCRWDAMPKSLDPTVSRIFEICLVNMQSFSKETYQQLRDAEIQLQDAEMRHERCEELASPRCHSPSALLLHLGGSHYFGGSFCTVPSVLESCCDHSCL